MLNRRLTYLIALALVIPVAFVALLYTSTTEAGPPGPSGNGDVNGDGGIDVGDPIYLLSFLFSSGPAPIAIAGGSSCLCEDGLFRISDPTGGPSTLAFGTRDDCTIGIDPPGLAGIVVTDPEGLRVRNPMDDGPSTVRFGGTDECSIGIDPVGLTGLIVQDPFGLRLLNPLGGSSTLRFGVDDLCRIRVEPGGPSGIMVEDPFGMRILNPTGGPSTLRFGEEDLCRIEVDPTGQSGVVIQDPFGMALVSPTGGPSTFRFGDSGECTIGIDPSGLSGLIVQDPLGMRILNPTGAKATLRFGETDLCRIEVDPGGTDGLLIVDPNGARIMHPSGGQSILSFGETGECRIRVGDPTGLPGMIFEDPDGFNFQGGPVFATDFIPTSASKYKENVRPIANALEKIQALEGVTFEWKGQLGGKTDIGFVAEDVAAVVPEVVACDKDGGARGVSYDHLVALAVEGIKAQQLLIEDLESDKTSLEDEIATLRTQNGTLAERLERLEALVSELAASSK